jgi:hypothetical protein
LLIKVNRDKYNAAGRQSQCACRPLITNSV